MREIKFRFWSPYNDEPYRMRIEHDGWVEGIGINEAIKASQEYGYIVMQYIGLKDKNGKEACEGDIIYSDNIFIKNIPLVIEYSDGCYIGVVKNREDVKGIKNLTDQPFEIIGNIYENPELIQE